MGSPQASPVVLPILSFRRLGSGRDRPIRGDEAGPWRGSARKHPRQPQVLRSLPTTCCRTAVPLAVSRRQRLLPALQVMRRGEAGSGTQANAPRTPWQAHRLKKAWHATVSRGYASTMLNKYKQAALQACRLIPALALPLFVASCTTPKSEVPTKAQAPAGNVVVDGNCAVDGQGRAKGRVRFNGWAVGSSKAAPETITVTIGSGQPITATLYDRPDIAKAYRSTALTKTGFTVEVDEAQAPAGAEIKIFANQGGTSHQCTKTFTLK